MFKIILFLVMIFNYALTYETKIFIANTYIPENFYKYDKEFKQAAKKYNIPMVLLKAISLTENAKYKHDIIGKNKNKTKDYGLMQINSIHLQRFGLKEKDIIKPSVNIDTAARLLHELIQKYGFNWDAIGRYHSANSKYKNIWLHKVMSHLMAIILKDSKKLISMEKFRVMKLASLLINFNEEHYIQLANSEKYIKNKNL